MEIIIVKSLDTWVKENNIELNILTVNGVLDKDVYFNNYGYGKYIMDKLGIKENDPLFMNGHFKHLHYYSDRYIKVNGIIYSNLQNDCYKFYSILYFYDDEIKKKNIGTICSCGSYKFIIHYGEMNLLGECTNCGIIDEIKIHL